MTDSITKAQAAAPAVDFDTMDPSELLKILIADQGEKAAEKADLKALQQEGILQQQAMRNRLETGLPPKGEEELHPNHWLVIHRGVSHKSVRDFDFPVSNMYFGIPATGPDGTRYEYTIAAGLQWLPTWAFSGSFDTPQTKHLAQAVDAGVIDVIPPGMPLEVRTLGSDLKEKLALGAMQLCKDARTMRFFANLAGGVNKDVMLRKADDLESERPARKASQKSTFAELVNDSK